jgi:uncharacterized protein YjbI with pentapeptide repeats
LPQLALALLLPSFLVLLALTAGVGFRLWSVPGWYLSGISDRARAINEYRTALGPIFIGMMQALGGAAILYGLWLNSREHAFTRLQHLAQRLKDATVQLESDHASTRVAAVHELEEIATTNEPKLPRILETLRLHIRNRAAPLDPAAPVRDRLLPDDVLTALAAVTRLQALTSGDEGASSARFHLDLRGADLRGMPIGNWIRDARLDEANLSGVHFSGHLLIAAPWALFRGAVFKSVTWYPNPEGGGLMGADFSGARFDSSILTSGEPALANLKGAVFDGATFNETVLGQCDLTAASIRNARFANRSAFQYNILAAAKMDGTTFSDSHVHPWQLPEFKKARTQPADYGDMTETWRAPGGPFAEGVPT